MHDIKYIITIGNHTSEPVKAKPLVAISKAFTADAQYIAVWQGDDVSHEFELAAGEDILDWAQAQLEDVQLDGGFEGNEQIVTILRDILFIR